MIKKAILLLLVIGMVSVVFGGEQGKDMYRLANERVEYAVFVKDGILKGEIFKSKFYRLKTDGDFGIDLQWTGWRAPGRVHNADNPVMLSKKDFKLVDAKLADITGGGKKLELLFKGVSYPLEIKLSYKLDKDAFYVQRRLSVRDPKPRNHFLRWLWARHGIIYGDVSILKPGGFGNPAVLSSGDTGAFFGMEYPAAENQLEPAGEGKTYIRTGQEMGMAIGKEWISGEWSVAALTPADRIKVWFKKYLDAAVRVAPLRPYLLYNTWYDVRAPEYTDRPEDVMNEANLLRIIRDFKREMVEKRGLKLDAFVLDDAWDIYKSDWVLRKEEFPNGLKPIVDELKGMNSDLGIWFGPIGGYSYRYWRVDWMKEHGYEVVGDQLCLAGKKYKELFKKRTTDFVRNDGVTYFKWDGIQFSCSEPDHGHPVGIYSRRAVMESVAELCDAVRAENPDVFLNITSGTWLSPWWLKYANQIWMQGYDYGYANVPSISRRDAAITYRDFVLYEDYGLNQFWFPIANLMTHGIIKGHLQKLGGEAEPLDKFTDNAILYFARGVSMYELYISPNLLTGGEWEAIGRSIRWAKDRFHTLKQTEMVGGNPGEKQAYGYVHFSGPRGIIAARNPFIQPQSLAVKLDPAHGICPKAASLVLERVYPTRWISPNLYAAGAVVELPLDGYETAIYEIYPLEKAPEPLFAGVTFDVVKQEGKEYTLAVRNVEKGARVLNPETVAGIKQDGELVPLYKFSLPETPGTAPITAGSIKKGKKGIQMDVQVDPSVQSARVCLLLEHSEKTSEYFRREEEKHKKAQKDKKIKKDWSPFRVELNLDGRPAQAQVERQKGRWTWQNVDIEPGKHSLRVNVRSLLDKKVKWTGNISAYVVYTGKPQSRGISFTTASIPVKHRPMPPLPRPAGIDQRTHKIGEIEIK